MTAGPTLDAIEHDGPAEAGRDFEAFFRFEHERLFRAMWLLTRDPHEAEEVTQEAFLRLWERWDRFRRRTRSRRLPLSHRHERLAEPPPADGGRRSQGDLSRETR